MFLSMEKLFFVYNDMSWDILKIIFIPRSQWALFMVSLLSSHSFALSVSFNYCLEVTSKGSDDAMIYGWM